MYVYGWNTEWTGYVSQLKAVLDAERKRANGIVVPENAEYEIEKIITDAFRDLINAVTGAKKNVDELVIGDILEIESGLVDVLSSMAKKWRPLKYIRSDDDKIGHTVAWVPEATAHSEMEAEVRSEFEWIDDLLIRYARVNPEDILFVPFRRCEVKIIRGLLKLIKA